MWSQALFKFSPSSWQLVEVWVYGSKFRISSWAGRHWNGAWVNALAPRNARQGKTTWDSWLTWNVALHCLPTCSWSECTASSMLQLHFSQVKNIILLSYQFSMDMVHCWSKVFPVLVNIDSTFTYRPSWNLNQVRKHDHNNKQMLVAQKHKMNL